ncbi:MAG: hypothetical protein ABIG96_03955 [Candidatus Micrarchaeota archaeon]
MASNPLEKEIRIDFSSNETLEKSISRYRYLGGRENTNFRRPEEVRPIHGINALRKFRVGSEVIALLGAGTLTLGYAGVYRSLPALLYSELALTSGLPLRQFTVKCIREEHRNFAEKLVKSDFIRNLAKTHPIMHVIGTELVLRKATAAELKKVAFQEKVIKFYKNIPVVKKYAEAGPASAWRWRVDLRKIMEGKQRA